MIVRLVRDVPVNDEEWVTSWLSVPAAPRWQDREWDLVLKMAMDFPEWEVDCIEDTMGNVIWDEFQI